MPALIPLDTQALYLLDQLTQAEENIEAWWDAPGPSGLVLSHAAHVAALLQHGKEAALVADEMREAFRFFCDYLTYVLPSASCAAASGFKIRKDVHWQIASITRGRVWGTNSADALMVRANLIEQIRQGYLLYQQGVSR
jgi:hypothetical protein